MNPRSTKNKETGMVLIFVVAAIFTLVILLGLFLDVGTMMIAKRDREKTARLVSSEAITVFNRSDKPKPLERVDDARDESEDLAETNLKLQFAKSFFKEQEIQTYNSSSSTPNDSYAGSLIPGVWYFNQQKVFDKDGNCAVTPVNNCPCIGNKWNGPCFRPLPGVNDAQASEINAFSANLNTKSSNNMKTTFMGIVGHKEVALRSQSTIAIRPLNVVVLVDLSRFVDEETHIPYEVAGLKGVQPPLSHNPARFAYPLSSPGNCSGTEPMANIGSLAPGQTTPATNELDLTCRRDLAASPAPNALTFNRVKSTCLLKGGDQIAKDFYNYTFNLNSNSIPNMFPAQWPAAPATNTATAPPTFHTKFDYRCVTMNFKREDGSKDLDEPYLVDFRRTPTYRGPEPLETFIQATRESLAKIEDRNLRGDSISIVGFDWDSEVTKRRKLNLNPIDSKIEPDGKTEFEKTKEYFDDPRLTANPYSSQRNRYQDLAFAPRIINRYLSIPDALNQAYKILKERPNFATADNMIILLTTGLTNCVKSGGTKQVCGQKTADFDSSINESIKFSEDYLKKQGILLHTLIRSPRVQPITKIVGKKPNNCKSEDSSQGFNNADLYNFTSALPPAPLLDTPIENQTGKFENGKLTFTKPFQLPNNLAKASLTTGGVWAPIRPACPGTKANLDNAINTYCKFNNPTPDYTDANGNIICDPSGLSAEEQTTNYISKMFDLTPLIPVSEGVNVN